METPPPSPDLPSGFLDRLELLDPGLSRKIIAAAASAAPRTLVLFGSEGLHADALDELADAGLGPEVIEEVPGHGLKLVAIRDDGPSLSTLDSFEFGCSYAQERSSFHLVARLISSESAPAAGSRVLDFCAAPGGKSLLLSQLSGVELVVNEPVRARRAALLHNLRRCGAPAHVRVASVYHHEIPPAWHGAFDFVLVDAPCSGEGLLRKPDKEGLGFWSLDRVSRCAHRQAGILDGLSRVLAPEGELVYSTCTFAPEEDEVLVHDFIERVQGFETAALPALDGALPGVPRWQGRELALSGSMARFYPSPGRPGEGLFAARLRLSGGVRSEPELPGRPLWDDIDGLIGGPRWSDARAWPKLHRLHADTFRRRRDRFELTEIEPRLGSLREWLRSCPASKEKRSRVVVWRHFVLLLEVLLKPGRSMIRLHPAVERRRQGTR